MTIYDDLRDAAVEALGELAQGTVTLTRTTRAATTSYDPGAVTGVAVYTLDAVVSGVSRKYVDGTLILASDLQLTVSPQATLSDGTTVADVAPLMTDGISVDGKDRKVKKILATPAAGTAAVYLIFIEG